MNIWNEIKQSFKEGSILIKLIYINLAVYLTINVFFLFSFISGGKLMFYFPITQWLAVPADFKVLIFKPWTLITYMFLHESLMHILFNILWLYWLGKIFLLYLDEKKLLVTYVLGGISGALLYVISFNIFSVFNPVNSYALGASASVMAIVITIAMYAPNHTINLMFIGPVKLKYVALVTIVLDVISIAGDNSGGHIAHIGGALYGVLFAGQLKKGKDIGTGFGKFLFQLFTLFKKKQKMKVSHKRPVNDMDYNAMKVKEQDEINRILDKIAKSGYDSLSRQEKDTLFKMSDKG